jgi:AraC-like DNA-binding protein
MASPDPAAGHRCRLVAAPCDGVYATCIESDRHFGRHWHETFGVGWLSHGAQRSASGRGPVEAFAGDVITTNPGEVHDGRPFDGRPRRWQMIYVDPAVLGPMASTGGASSLVSLTRPVLRDAALATALQRLFRTLEHDAGFEADAPLQRLAFEASFVRVVARLLARHSTDRPEAPADVAIERVRERLAAATSLPPSLADLAAAVGLSRYQLLRRFERVHGVPPHAWWRSRRIERARTCVRRGIALADAAALCGFADQSHLTREFQRLCGFAPGAWQAATRGGRRPQ